MTPPRITGLALGAAVTLLPFAAIACPACAGRDPGGSGTWILLAAMIGVPYAVGAVAWKVIRSVDNDSGEQADGSRDRGGPA